MLMDVLIIRGSSEARGRMCKRAIASSVLVMISVLLVFSNNPGSAKILNNPSGKPWSDYRLVIIKHELKLYFYKGKDIVKAFPVAIGRNPGDKLEVGDMRTPEGNFYIEKIHDSRNWVHDFKDGNGPIKGAYGPYFFRLYTGVDRTCSGKAWKGIGIHGTHDPTLIGKTVTEGCIRLHNEDLEDLRKYIRVGIPVSILP